MMSGVRLEMRFALAILAPGDNGRDIWCELLS